MARRCDEMPMTLHVIVHGVLRGFGRGGFFMEQRATSTSSDIGKGRRDDLGPAHRAVRPIFTTAYRGRGFGFGENLLRILDFRKAAVPS